MPEISFFRGSLLLLRSLKNLLFDARLDDSLKKNFLFWNMNLFLSRKWKTFSITTKRTHLSKMVRNKWFLRGIDSHAEISVLFFSNQMSFCCRGITREPTKSSFSSPTVSWSKSTLFLPRSWQRRIASMRHWRTSCRRPIPSSSPTSKAIDSERSRLKRMRRTRMRIIWPRRRTRRRNLTWTVVDWVRQLRCGRNSIFLFFNPLCRDV